MSARLDARDRLVVEPTGIDGDAPPDSVAEGSSARRAWSCSRPDRRARARRRSTTSSRCSRSSRTPRQTLRTIAFLLFDHIGGINTLLYTLSNAGCVVTVDDRSPEHVCRAIASASRRAAADLADVPQPAAGQRGVPTLRPVQSQNRDLRHRSHAGKHAQAVSRDCSRTSTLQQTYGLSEVGILRSKSRSSDSLWVKIGGEDFRPASSTGCWRSRRSRRCSAI